MNKFIEKFFVFSMLTAFFIIASVDIALILKIQRTLVKNENTSKEETVSVVEWKPEKEIPAAADEDLIESANTGHEETPEEVEGPDEAYYSIREIIDSIGTDKERECFGYDFSFVCRVLMQEAGWCSREGQKFVATIMLNDLEREQGKYNLEEIMNEYDYADPYQWASDEVIQTAVDVFLMGEKSELAADALYCYAPEHTENNWSEWHERQTFVAECEGIKAFK